MSTDSPNTKRKKQTPEFVESIVDTFKQNGGLFTVFAVVLILVVGITIIDNPQNWWISVASIIGFFTVVFLFMNARVFLKVILATIVTLALTSFAFQIGSLADPRGAGGLVWMSATLFLFFTCLAVSYMLSSGRSRWGSITLSQIVTFSTVYVLSMGLGNVDLAVIAGSVSGFLVFLMIYKLTPESRFSKSGMPQNRLTEDVITSIEAAAEDNVMNSVALLGKKENSGSVLVWSDRAYLLHPVNMDSAFTAIGRKALKLGYKRKNINPWLINIAFNENPTRKSRGANIIPILVDLNNANGDEPRVIGATLPDTTRKLPVGVLPGKAFLTNNPDNLREAMETIEREFSDFVKPLNDKHKIALSRFGKFEETEEKESNA